MKKFVCISSLLLSLAACNTKKSSETMAIETDSDYNPNTSESISYTSNTSSDIVPSTETQTANQGDSSTDYNSGKSFGYNMGYIAGQECSEYNPYLPVGPNVSSYSIEYRQGYAAGYSEGYEKGQQATHQGMYADDNDCTDDGGGNYYYEDDDY